MSKLYDFTGELIHTTYHDKERRLPKAYLFSDGIKEFWLPADATEIVRKGAGSHYEVTIPMRLAYDKKLI